MKILVINGSHNGGGNRMTIFAGVSEAGKSP